MSFTDLPLVNACLNGLSTVLLTAGFVFIKRGRKLAHRNCMLAALVTSTIFLVCYLTYHYQMKQAYGEAHTRFLEPAWFRPIYLTILFTHLLGAFAIVPLVLITLTRALRERFEAHKRIARWTWPVWMYVSVTGVVIYLLLYQIFPQR
jgi:uncharacterized membrane protein YozB (DUF420 family)